jgi:hypothetical protein
MSSMYKTYKVENTENITLVPITQIEFSTPMIKQLEKLGLMDEYKNYHKKEIVYENLIIKDRGETLGLSRIDRVIQGIVNKEELPPVKLQIHESQVEVGTVIVPRWIPRSQRGKDNVSATIEKKIYETRISYSVDDGRHRVVAGLFLDLKHIPAIIKK